MRGDETVARTHEVEEVGFLIGIEWHVAVALKKIASTFARLGPPLAGVPSVFFGVLEMMLESVRMSVSQRPDS